MSALLVTIADALTAELNAHDFGVQFKAERSYADWDELLEELDTLRVDVVPVGYGDADLESRGTLHYLPAVDIGVRRHFGSGDEQENDGRIDQAQIDALVLLVEQIHAFFTKQRPDDTVEAIWKQGKVNVTFNRQMLRDHRQFMGIVRFTFDAYQALA